MLSLHFCEFCPGSSRACLAVLAPLTVAAVVVFVAGSSRTCLMVLALLTVAEVVVVVVAAEAFVVQGDGVVVLNRCVRSTTLLLYSFVTLGLLFCFCFEGRRSIFSDVKGAA